MKIPRFLGTITSADYKMAPKKNGEDYDYYTSVDIDAYYDESGEIIDQLSYYADVRLKENSPGKSRGKKGAWKATIYLTEEQYDTQFLEVGDVVLLTDCNLKKNDFKLTVYDKEKLAEYPAVKMRIKYKPAYGCKIENHADICTKCPNKKKCPDKTKYQITHAVISVSDCKLFAKIGHTKIVCKGEEMFKGKIERVSFTFENAQELMDFQEGDFYLEGKEIEQIKKVIEQYGNGNIPMKFSRRSRKCRVAYVEITLADETDEKGRMWCNVSVVREATDEPLDDQE